MIERKRCPKCGKTRILSKFYKSKSSRDGYRCYCKKCTNGYSQTEEGKEAQKRWRQSDKGKETQKRYFQTDKGKKAQRRYFQTDKGKESIKRYAQTENGKEVQKRYLQSEKGEKAKERYKQSKNGNKVIRVLAINGRARRKMINDEITVADIKFIEKKNIEKYSELTCEYCKKPIDETEESYHADHKIPYSKGGENKRNNICVCCGVCNRKKHNMTAREWNKKLQMIMSMV